VEESHTGAGALPTNVIRSRHAAALGGPAAAAVPMDAWLRRLRIAPRSGSR
jgi:hypothetical protein